MRMPTCSTCSEIRLHKWPKCNWWSGEQFSTSHTSHGMKKSMITWLLQVLLVILSLSVSSAAANSLALLAGTLKTFQRHACQGAVLPLQCPLNTTIDVLHANYGGAQPPLCPFLKDPEPGMSDQRGRCDYPAAVNYKIIQTVMELCHRKRSCSVSVPAPDEYAKKDPCPHSNKYVEVAFKCRPDTFINKVLCEGEELTLDCGTQSRIAIYTSMFGRTKHGSVLCPQTEGLPETDCLAKFATDKVITKCHGFPKCQLSASSEVFGNPCPPKYPMYLKTVYTCVPSWILKPPENRKKLSLVPPTTKSPLDTPDARMIEETKERFETTTPKLQDGVESKPNKSRTPLSTSDIINCTVTILSGSQQKEVGIIREWMRAVAFINKHFEKFILYLILGLIVGVLLCVLAVSLRLIMQQRKLKSHAQDTGHFVGDIDDVDADLDMITPPNSSSEDGGYSPTPPVPLQDQNVVRYNSGTSSRLPNVRASEVRPSVRYHDVDLIPPRSLSRENNHYLYN